VTGLFVGGRFDMERFSAFCRERCMVAEQLSLVHSWGGQFEYVASSDGDDLWLFRELWRLNVEHPFTFPLDLGRLRDMARGHSNWRIVAFLDRHILGCRKHCAVLL
jgi:hypothetical protein